MEDVVNIPRSVQLVYVGKSHLCDLESSILDIQLLGWMIG